MEGTLRADPYVFPKRHVKCVSATAFATVRKVLIASTTPKDPDTCIQERQGHPVVRKRRFGARTTL